MPEEELQRPLPTETIVKPQVKEPFKPEPVLVFSQKVADELNSVIPPFPTRTRITPTLTQEIKDRIYRNFIVDLTAAHTDLPLGIRGLGIVATSITVIQVDSAFSYKINRASNDSTPVTTSDKGLSETEFEIEELYITNAALSGQAIIRAVWNPLLIRPE
jgi:hypothetical protein